jgi:hypothetical protein
MTSIFLATEIDEGMGHIAPWFGFVEQALGWGCQVDMAAPNVGLLNRTIGSRLPVRLWSGPRLRPLGRDHTGGHQPVAKSWVELLVGLGYAQPLELEGMVKAWCNLLTLVAPSVVLADFAPALILAGRILNIPVFEVGGGYCVPPLSPQLENFPGVPRDSAGLMRADLALCASVNRCLARFNLPLIATYGEVQSWPTQRVVRSPAELDHYGPRSGVTYAGLLSPAPSSNDPTAPFDPWPAVVGYLKSSTPGVETLLAELSDNHIPALIHMPGLPAEGPRVPSSVRLTHQPIDLASALEHAHVYLSNGGLHGVGLALQRGCWPVVVPQQAEQVAMARNLVRRGWGSICLAGTAQSALPAIQAAIAANEQGTRRTKLPFQNQSAEEVLLRLLCVKPATPSY